MFKSKHMYIKTGGTNAAGGKTKAFRGVETAPSASSSLNMSRRSSSLYVQLTSGMSSAAATAAAAAASAAHSSHLMSSSKQPPTPWSGADAIGGGVGGGGGGDEAREALAISMFELYATMGSIVKLCCLSEMSSM